MLRTCSTDSRRSIDDEKKPRSSKRKRTKSSTNKQTVVSPNQFCCKSIACVSHCGCLAINMNSRRHSFAIRVLFVVGVVEGVFQADYAPPGTSALLRSDPPLVTATINLQELRPAIQLGAGNELVWQSVNDSRLAHMTAAIGGTVGRYPGGTPSDYWDWQTGWCVHELVVADPFSF